MKGSFCWSKIQTLDTHIISYDSCRSDDLQDAQQVFENWGEVYIFHNLCFLRMGLGFEVANQFHILLNVCIDSVFCVKIYLLWPRNPDETCARLWQLMHHIKTNHTWSLQELRWWRRTDWKGTAASGGGRTGWSSDEQGRLPRARSYSLRHAIGSTRRHRTRRRRCRRAEAAGSGGPHLTSRSADQG
jgi:hypothetical protein